MTIPLYQNNLYWRRCMVYIRGAQRPGQRWNALLLAVVIAFIGNMVCSLLPIYLKEGYALDGASIGYLLPFFGLGGIRALSFVGRLIYRIGVKRSLVLAMGFCIVSSFGISVPALPMP